MASWCSTAERSPNSITTSRSNCAEPSRCGRSSAVDRTSRPKNRVLARRPLHRRAQGQWTEHRCSRSRPPRHNRKTLCAWSARRRSPATRRQPLEPLAMRSRASRRRHTVGKVIPRHPRFLPTSARRQQIAHAIRPHVEHSDPARTHEPRISKLVSPGQYPVGGQASAGNPRVAVNFFQQTVHVLFGWRWHQETLRACDLQTGMSASR